MKNRDAILEVLSERARRAALEETERPNDISRAIVEEYGEIEESLERAGLISPGALLK